jgi:hypothetical protein
VTNLSRLAILGMAKETTAGTYVAPTFSVPFTKASYETMQAPLRDESIRANDAVLQGLYAGPSEGTFDIEFHAYPDIVGNFLRMIGPDTVTPATTTTLSSSSSIGATSISTVASIPAGSTIRIDTAANTEYATTGTPTGAGPYSIPIVTPAALTIAHSSSVAVTTTTTHTFKQTGASRPPAWSISVYDLVDYRGWAGCVMSELAIKIDPKGTVTMSPKFVGFAEASQASFSYATSSMQPWVGWQWTLTNAGGASTRGLSYDVTLKRAAEVVHSSDGTQGPREVYNGALDAHGALKCIYENTTDMNEFLNYTQRAVTATVTKPTQVGGVQLGGESLALTMSTTGYSKGQRDLGGTYVQAAYDLDGIYNATDAGVVQAVLKNFTTAAY